MTGVEGSARIPPRAWYTLGILTLIYVVSFIDRQILSILAESIKLDLNLTDAQLGFLYGTSFAVFFALFGVPLGRLADTWNRVWLVALGLVGWSLMTSASGFATTFAMLALARVGVGVGEASTSPAAYSLIADYFPAQRRTTALGIYASGLYIGLGLSLPVGSFLLSFWTGAFPDAGTAPLGLSPWQATFVLVGLPGFLVALLMLTVRDPAWTARSAKKSSVLGELWRDLFAIIPPFTLLSTARFPGELRRNVMAALLLALAAALLCTFVGDPVQWIIYAVGVYAVFSWTQSIKHRDSGIYQLIFGTPVAVLLIFAFGSIAFITYSTGFWTSPYALRTFYAGPADAARLLEGKTALQEVSTLVGWGTAFGSAAGVIVGGIVADRWRRHDPRGRIFTIIASLLVSAPLAFAMFNTTSIVVFYVLAPIASFAGAAYSGGAIASVQDLVLPRMRATAGAAFVLGITLVGLALGPYISGKIATEYSNLRLGILGLYYVAPLTLAVLWYCAKHLQRLEATRGERAGEALPERHNGV